MAPTILICPGATKAGTSWLYRFLHDHPDCHLRAEKELHFWDAPEGYDDVLTRKIEDYDKSGLEASVYGNVSKAQNMARRVKDLKELRAVFQSGDPTEYFKYLTDGAGQAKLVADITPSYAMLPSKVFSQMLTLPLPVKVLYLMRDPLARLWSHVRMQAYRQLAEGEEITRKAKNILNRTVNKGRETHIPLRGDYIATVKKLQEAVPPDQLMIAYMENMYKPDGLAEICAFLDIDMYPADFSPFNVGPSIVFPENKRQAAMEFLAPQYDFAQKHFPPVPTEWGVVV